MWLHPKGQVWALSFPFVTINSNRLLLRVVFVVVAHRWKGAWWLMLPGRGDHLVDASGMIENHASRECLLHAPVEYHRHISCLPVGNFYKSKTERVLVEDGRKKMVWHSWPALIWHLTRDENFRSSPRVPTLAQMPCLRPFLSPTWRTQMDEDGRGNLLFLHLPQLARLFRANIICTMCKLLPFLMVLSWMVA